MVVAWLATIASSDRDLWVTGRGEDLAGEADARSGTREAIVAVQSSQ